MNKDDIIATAILGFAGGLLVGSTVIYIAAKKDIKNLERRLQTQRMFRKTMSSWLSKAIADLPEDKAQAIIKEMVDDVKFHIITQPLEK